MDFVFRRTYQGRIKAVILDWAGTTVDYGSFAPTAVFMRLFESRGVTISVEDARTGMGLMKKDHLRAILARPSVAEAWQAIHGAPATDADIEEMFAHFVKLQISVLADYADPIPGLLDVLKELRGRGVKVGSTTGYLSDMMAVLGPEAARRGYVPDCIVCPDQVPAGRPYPWMCYQNMIQLGVYPNEAVVKVGDTLPDIEEGLNAGMWTVGVALTGSLLGLREAEVNALTMEERQAARERIADQLYRAGAHEVIDGIWDLPSALARIEQRLARGEHP
ncbi:MAG: phosphonoacetaldehyde hydrolase [Anaerolineae bacterium]|nr:phosphonoacetaldehyde hydrolase [Anaerolineae bacterium]MDW8100040.1 phosphonoacetaldehyde hydrolase [Anaerolineae bacterium]